MKKGRLWGVATAALVVSVVPISGPPAGAVTPQATGGSGSGAGTGWTIQSEGLDFTTVDCPTQSACWAVGDDATGDGIVAASTDGGTTWAQQSLPTGTDGLSAVSCADATHCWAVESALSFGLLSTIGLVRNGASDRTGGLAPSDAAARLEGLARRATTSSVTSAATSGVVATTDGGATWTAQSLPSGVSALIDIACPTDSDCWAVGAGPATTSSVTGVLLTTADGGATWAAVTDPAPQAILTGISCPSSTMCIAVGLSQSAGTSASYQSSAVAITMGTGGTWSQSSLGSAASSFALDQVSCTTTLSCMAVGSGSDSSPIVLTTSDGGATWKSEPFTLGSRGISSVSCPSSECWVTSGTGVFSTSDGGAHWSAQSIGSVSADIVGSSCPRQTSTCVILESSGAGPGLVEVTTDGGTTWAAHELAPSIPQVNAMSCPDATHCFAAGTAGTAGGVVATADGGTTWNPQTLPSAASPLDSIACPTDSSCLAGGSGSLVETTDGGTTWTSVSAPVGTASVEAIACPDTTHCFVSTGTSTSGISFGGSSPSTTSSVLATTDGGTTWSSDPLPAGTPSLGTIACTSDQDCIAATGISGLDLVTQSLLGGLAGSMPASAVLVTTDGGTTWSTTTLPPGIGQLGNLSCPSASACFLAALTTAGSSVLLQSGDGGNSWSVLGFPASAPTPEAFDCPTANVCEALAVNLASLSGTSSSNSGGSTIGSEVLSTTDGGATWSTAALPGQESIGAALACGDATHCWASITAAFNIFSSTTALAGTSTADSGTPLSIPSQGYLAAAANGEVYPFGSGESFGSPSTLTLTEPVVGIAPTPDGKGYWEVASDGGIFASGDAGYYGTPYQLDPSKPAGGNNSVAPLNKPVVGMAATADGKGYWEVASDGGIFTFGDAGFYGSTGAIKLVQPIDGMAPTADGKGYWLVASDGGVFTFGDAGFHGSASGTLPWTGGAVSSMAATPGGGYWLVTTGGAVYPFGDAGSFGSASGLDPSASIVAIAPTADGRGYWEWGSDGTVYPYGDATDQGSAAAVFSGAASSGLSPSPIVAGAVWPAVPAG